MFRYRLTIDGMTLPLPMSLRIAADLLETAKRNGHAVAISARIAR